MSFDHRTSITRYLEGQAAKFEAHGNRAEATALRATASSIAAQLDITPGSQEIATPVDAIINKACAAFGFAGLPSRNEVLGHCQTKPVVRARFAAIWVASKRLGWTQEKLGDAFGRDSSTISHALHRAEEIRNEDDEFSTLTDRLVAGGVHCEHCQQPLA